jgi:hypothetical protein
VQSDHFKNEIATIGNYGFCARWYFFRDAAGIVGEGGGWDRGRKLASSRAPLGRRAPCFCFTTGSGHPTAGYRGRVCTVKASEKTVGKTYSCTIMVYLDLLLDRVCLNLKNVEPAREAIKWSFIFQICFLSWKDIISHCTKEARLHVKRPLAQPHPILHATDTYMLTSDGAR